MKEKKSILYFIIAVIIIIGVVFIKVKGFNFEIDYSNRQQIILTNKTGLDIDKIEKIAKEVLDNKDVSVKKIELFGNGVEIISTGISDEEKNNIVTKVNEELNESISSDEIKVTTIANTRLRDILKPYILPVIITFVAVLLYFIIMYHKIGLKKVLIKTIAKPIVVELVYFALVAITRVPLGRVQNSIAIGLYVISIMFLTFGFQKEKEKITNTSKKEND